jgi:hypothetical protein
MKIFNSLECSNFYICYGYASPGEVVTHPNTAVGNTQNQFYLVDGSVNVSNGTTNYDLPHKQWKDLKEFKTDRILTYTVGNDGCSWVIILPKVNATEYTMTEVNDGVIPAEEGASLLVTEGESVTMNGATLKQLNVVPLNKAITLVKNGGKVHKIK